MENQNESRFAVITGASSGIGFCLATQFLENGFDILIASESTEIHTAAENLPKTGNKIEVCQANLATYGGVEELYEKIQSLNRVVDAVAINAGVEVFGNFATETKLEDELNLIQLNIVQPVHLSKLILKDMVARNSGKILFTSSVAGSMPGPLYAVYAASKAFITSFSEAIRNELKETGVTITALLPGATDTNFFERAGMQGTRVDDAKKDDPMDVAREGFEAMMAGKDKVVYGFLNRVEEMASRLMSEPMKAAAQRREMEPSKKSKEETAEFEKLSADPWKTGLR